MSYNIYTYDENILKSLSQLLQHYCQQHGKALVVRFDVRFPQGFPIVNSNEYFSSFIAKLKKKYDRQGLDARYFWVIEQHHSVHPHYHIVIFLNGNKVRSYGHVFDSAEQLWQSTLGVEVSGCIEHCSGQYEDNSFYNGKLLVRASPDFQQQYEAVSNQLSYLAKTYTKNYEQDGLRNYGCSRIL